MYKELVESIESNLRRFVEVPELASYVTEMFITEIDPPIFHPYSIRRVIEDNLVVTVNIGTSEYVFEGDWEKILDRLTELWVNE